MPLTATMVMREVEKGKLSLDDSLSKFYPTVPGAEYVKIRNLLNMTSGLDIQPGKKLDFKLWFIIETTIVITWSLSSKQDITTLFSQYITCQDIFNCFC